MQTADRKQMILNAAMRIANERDFTAVNHSSVAKRCTIQTSTSTVRHYFKQQRDLWREVYDMDHKGFRDKAVAVGLIPGDAK
jgi:AcrR family transcriptional regulator